MYFPMYIEMKNRKVLVAGAGKIASRRIKTLFRFGADIIVVAPKLSTTVLELSGHPVQKESGGRVQVFQRKYRTEDLVGIEMVIAATDSQEVNRKIFLECRKRGISVNVADDHTLCDFYFPSVIVTEDVAIGISSGGKNPGKTSEVRKKIEELFHAEKQSLYEQK